MGLPASVENKLDEVGAAIRAGTMTVPAAVAEAGRFVRANAPELVEQVMAEWVRRRVRAWLHAQANANPAQLVIPFPDLPPQLEIAPGRPRHQLAMTGPDWDHARGIWGNRRDQAERGWLVFEESYRRVRPHLTDDELTTADVLHLLEPVAVEAAR